MRVADDDMHDERPGWASRLRTALTSSERRRQVRESLAERRAVGRAKRHSGSFPTLDQMLTPDFGAVDSRRLAAEAQRLADDAPEHAGLQSITDGLLGEPAESHTSTSGSVVASRFGQPGTQFNRQHPFYIGFVGALGVLVAIGLVQMLGQLTQIITLLVVSLFLALGLEPLVEWLSRHHIPRGWAITLVFLAVVAVFVGFGASVVPILVEQGTELARQVPQYFEQVQKTDWFVELDQRYDLVGRATEEVQNRLGDGEAMAAVFGGVLGAGQAVLTGIFSATTVLILTLYFLAAMRAIRATGYSLVPASRRHRVQLLGDEISRRIGGYVLGQLAIASLNGICSYVLMLILGIPYPAVLAIAVGIVGLIPLVGATLGAVVVVTVSLFIDIQTALIVLVYYVLYQQVENYLIAPKIMARTVSVPGAVALVAALTGATLLGALGALIAIPFAAGVLLVIQEVVMPRQNRH